MGGREETREGERVGGKGRGREGRERERSRGGRREKGEREGGSINPPFSLVSLQAWIFLLSVSATCHSGHLLPPVLRQEGESVP